MDVTNGQPVVSIELFNAGNEPVQVLSVESEIGGHAASQRLSAFPGGRSSATPFPLLPCESFYQQFSITGPLVLPGNYQAIIRIEYADFAGLPFSSVTVSDFFWPGKGGAGKPEMMGHGWLSLSVKPLDLGQTGVVKTECLLLQDEPVEATMRLVLPVEFECQSVERKVRLTADDTSQESFTIRNCRGLAGGNYPIYVIVEQNGPGFHRSVSAEGVVTVCENAWAGPAWWVWLAGALMLLMFLMAGRRPVQGVGVGSIWFDASLLTILSGFILWHVSPSNLIRDTVAVGGDTPAHLYLVSHLKEQLFRHGRIISWAGGWWGGFPMFQYYFPLPYLVAALSSVVIPLNVAFKLVSVTGLVLTPLCAYLAGRLWRLPRPIPLVLAMAMAPFLFVTSHTMWGVNTASTLAGMISNSWSFALMLVALASASRDAEDGVFRMRTVGLMVLVLASHFFTSVMMFLGLAIVPLIQAWHDLNQDKDFEQKSRSAQRGIFLSASGGKTLSLSGIRDFCLINPFYRAGRVLVLESLLAILLMAWWIVPLVAKSGFSMDFGTNWDVTLWKSFPGYGSGLVVFAGMAFLRRERSAIGLLLWMLIASAALFLFGFSLSPVFVNVRLWPFIFFALMALAAIGVGGLLVQVRGQTLLLLGLMAGILALAVDEDSLSGLAGPGRTRLWAQWNFSGLEAKPAASVFKTLVMPLKGTPGRLANDLCEENNQMGSSRIFELAPALAGKPVLEGGLVNSALGSMYAYSIQGETSDSCAGFPPIVTPQPFNFTNATRHLELFNVKHFIARSEGTKAALGGMPEWRLLGRELDWELYELTSHSGRYVFIPPRLPVVVKTGRWKECSLEWLYTPEALNQFVIWSSGSESEGDCNKTLRHLTEKQFLDSLARLKKDPQGKGLLTASPLLAGAGTGCIQDEDVTDDHIRFKTSAIGQPHIVKVSWFPNWKVRGASAVYRVSPGFMLVFPERANVELYYGSVWSDWVGYGLTVLGVVGVAWAMRRRVQGCRRKDSHAS